MIGRKLANRYQIIEKVGSGGMAIVYKARCTLLNRTVAIKVLRPQYVHDEEFVKKFRREAQSSASLSHPNIVGVYDVGQEKSNYFMVMEYVDGMTLKEYIKSKGFLEPMEALKITKEVAQALVHAHENSIIHRDIKPHNILLTSSMRVKVTDFGIAKAITSNTLTAQNTNSIMGSVHYFSPEQAKGNYTGAQSDIYSLGIVLYEMLTGQLPFDGESPISIAIKHIQEKVQPIKEIKPDIPEDIEKIVEKCLQKNKDIRYNSVSELLDDIKTWLKFGEVNVEMNENSDQETQVFTGVGDEVGEESKKPKNKSSDTDKKKKIIKISAIAGGSILLLLLLFWSIKSFFHVPEVVVPNVEGLPLREAVQLLKEEGLEYTLSDEVFHEELPVNHVVYQNPIPDTRVKEGREITLTLSGGPEILEVPDVIGKEERTAALEIEQAGFEAIFEYETSDTVSEGKVIRQSPLGGTQRRGETVTVVVSTGRERVTIPNIDNLTVEDATEKLRNAQINVRNVIYNPSQGDSPSGIVVGHSHQDNSTVQMGTAIDLHVRPFEQKFRTYTISNRNIDEPYSLRVVLTDLGGERIIYDRVVNPDDGDVEIDVTYWEQGKVDFYRDNILDDTKKLP